MKKSEDSRYDPEKVVAIRRIRKLMEFWRISPHELRGLPTPVARPELLPVVRYRHPLTGRTWDGEGGQPQWLREALIKEGYTVEELRRCARASEGLESSPEGTSEADCLDDRRA
ncbi:H-NS histone family protein [Sphaerotilus hippei]|uniref:H-NS histone family protein n=1 Tax=Sphaerotilus hippei TaxID=744406 RepID=A0A318H4F0_9BURK|nr:H-NS family nucleoid-associated regulatory protein [Sphaerotilus hippei]PXW98692.1 H-NS histone family protein [Sphaerotilus hippei]